MSLSFKDMSNYNRLRILNLIKYKGPISRSELVDEINLTAPTISRISKELMEENLVVETGRRESKVGRKPILLEFNAQSRAVLGIDLRPDSINGIITNLNAKPLEYMDTSFDSEIPTEELIEKLKGFTKELINKAQRFSPVLGLGVAVPGVIDSNEGIVRYSAPMGWSNINLKKHLDELCEGPVKIENLTRAAALGEKWLGCGVDKEDFIYVYVGKGIGAGVIANDELYRGSQYNAAEIGHTTIEMNGRLCRCGNRGCLEAYCSLNALQEFLEEELEREINTEEELWDELQKENESIKRVIGDIMEYLGAGIANIVNIFNPETIIICGWPQKVNYPTLLDDLRSVVKRRAMEGMLDNMEITFCNNLKKGPLLGAVTLILEDYLKPSLVKSSINESENLLGKKV